MNKTLKTLIIATAATLGLNGMAVGQITMGQRVLTATTTTTTTNADSTITRTTTTTEVELEPDFVTDILKASMKSMGKTIDEIFTGVKVAADTSWAKNADALREIIKVDAQTANQIMDMLNVVADSVASRSKGTIGTTKKMTVGLVSKISEAVKRGAEEMEEEANKRNEALTDSVKKSIVATQTAIDELVKKMDEETDDQQK